MSIEQAADYIRARFASGNGFGNNDLSTVGQYLDTSFLGNSPEINQAKMLQSALMDSDSFGYLTEQEGNYLLQFGVNKDLLENLNTRKPLLDFLFWSYEHQNSTQFDILSVASYILGHEDRARLAQFLKGHYQLYVELFFDPATCPIAASPTPDDYMTSEWIIDHVFTPLRPGRMPYGTDISIQTYFEQQVCSDFCPIEV